MRHGTRLRKKFRLGLREFYKGIKCEPYAYENQQDVARAFIIGLGELCIFGIGPNEVANKS